MEVQPLVCLHQLRCLCPSLPSFQFSGVNIFFFFSFLCLFNFVPFRWLKEGDVPLRMRTVSETKYTAQFSTIFCPSCN